MQVAAGAVAAVFAFPAIYLIWRNATAGTNPVDLLFSDRTLPPLWRTLRLATLVAASTAVMGTGLAWLTHRTDLPGRRLWRVLLPLPLVYPSFVGAAALIRTVNPGGLLHDVVETVGLDVRFELRGLFGAWVVLTLFTYPYVYLPVAARMRALSSSAEESARMLGDSSWRCFIRIVLPQSASAITAGAMLVFLYSISDFGAVQLMRYDTLTRAIWTTKLNNPTVSFALSLILLAVAAVAVWFERSTAKRLPVVDLARTSRPAETSLGRWRVPATAAVAVVVLAALIGPGASLIDWVVDGLSRQQRGGRALTISTSDVVGAAVNTTSASLITALVATAAVLPVAYLVVRHRSAVGTGSNTIVTATFALPGLLIALSIFFFTAGAPWVRGVVGGTMATLIVAYVIHFGAQSLAASRAAVATLPTGVDDAARVLGAGRWRRFVTVHLPIMAPGLIAGAGLVLLSTMKELPISLLIAPIGFSTLATRTFQSFEDAFVAEAGITALVLVVLSGALTWLLVVRRDLRS